MSRPGIFSFRNRSAVPPVEIMSTPCRSSVRANLAIPLLSETEMRAREIFIGVTECWSVGVMKLGRTFLHYSPTPLLQRRWVAIENHVLRRWIQHRTAADRFAKCFAELAEAGITDFGGSFGDVITAGPQQFGRALHPKFQQTLRNGHPPLPRKTPAQIKRTA